MNLLVFAGFLGSGKTTLIIELAKRLAAAGRTTCFIVNEVGEVGIDQQVMRDGGLNVWEITSGCICCQLGVDLVTTLQEISERYHPDVVIVEASGVATPAGILDALAYYRGHPYASLRTLTVVDPTRLEALLAVMTPLIEGQIRGADEIVINKLDEASPAEVKLAREEVARLHPGALYEVSAVDEDALAPLLEDLLAALVS